MLYTFAELQNFFAPHDITLVAHGGGIDFYRPAGDYVSISTSALPATIEALRDLVDSQFANADKYINSAEA